MRLVTPGDSAPASVNRYLLPHETQRIMVRRHPAVLLVPVSMVLAGLIIAGVLSNTVADRAGQLVSWIWWIWLALLAWFVWKVAEWSVEYFVITNQRMLLTSGIITHKVAMMPLSKVTDMSFERSINGRLLGYGQFVLESAGQDQALRTVNYLPYPEQLYLEVCDMIFPPPKPVEREEELRGEIRKILDRLETIDRLLGEAIPEVLDRLETIETLLERSSISPDEQGRLNEEKDALLSKLQLLRQEQEADGLERAKLIAERDKLHATLREFHNELEKILAEKAGPRRPHAS